MALNSITLGRTMTTSHRNLQFSEQKRTFSVYTDHSQDPIADALAFIFCRSPRSPHSIAGPVIDATGEGATETSRSVGTTVAANKPSDDQNETVDFRLIESFDRPAPFPWVLYCLLEDCMTNGMHRIISWGKHGRAFEVHDRDGFEALVMPR